MDEANNEILIYIIFIYYLILSRMQILLCPPLH